MYGVSSDLPRVRKMASDGIITPLLSPVDNFERVIARQRRAPILKAGTTKPLNAKWIALRLVPPSVPLPQTNTGERELHCNRCGMHNFTLTLTLLTPAEKTSFGRKTQTSIKSTNALTQSEG